MKVLGYNTWRPKEENYLDFERKMTDGLLGLDIRGLSLMFFGSYVRRDWDIGRSDIDSLLVFPSDVVIDKAQFLEVAKVLADALRGNPIPFSVTPTDRRIMRDGRFNAYDESFIDYFEEEGRVVVGPDYRGEFHYEFPTMSDQTPLRGNLKKSREGLLFSVHDMEEDYTELLHKFHKTLDAASRGSKQVLHFFDGHMRRNRFSALEEIPRFMPEVNIEPLERIKRLYKDLKSLDKLYRQPEEVIKVWAESLTFFEEMVKGYMDRVPHKK